MILRCRLSDLGAGAGSELARGDRRGVEHGGDRRELEAEAVVQHERNALPRREPVEHHLKGDTHGVRERNLLSWVGRGLSDLDLTLRDRCAHTQTI